MNPNAFYVFGFPIRWYGILISSGILIGLAVASITSKYRNINFDNLLDYF